MASELSILNSANELAYLSGLFNWQIDDAKYTTPSGNTISFNIISSSKYPIAQYLQGAINTFNLATSKAGVSFSDDPNVGLFNTTMSSSSINESITRKYVLYQVPFANYDIPTDLGVGGQEIKFNIIFTGTMYLTAFNNFVQYIFDNSIAGLGSLTHPVYNKINNVLPIKITNEYKFDKLNCVVVEIMFITSDITHLDPNSITNNILQEISTYYVGTQNAITSLAGIINTIPTLGNQIISGLI